VERQVKRQTPTVFCVVALQVSEIMFKLFPFFCGLKNIFGLLSLLLNFALPYAIWSFPLNHYSLKINVTLQILPYADDINILFGEYIR
jgi:hypothetical protein